MARYCTIVTSATLTCSAVCDFPTPGAYTWTVPSGVTEVTFEIWGPGGGGGAKCCCECYHGGPPGAGGGYSSVTVATAAGCAYAVCVGYGGMVTGVGSCTLHWCCYGQPGSTTYVTGFNLSNLCATGGDGGRNDCYYICGCNVNGGIGYGGTVVSCGSGGANQGYSDAYFWRFAHAGAPPFTGASRPMTGDHCCPCMLGYPGVFPGGGGATVMPNICCCCSQGGVGANGLVRIHF